MKTQLHFKVIKNCGEPSKVIRIIINNQYNVYTIHSGRFGPYSTAVRKLQLDVLKLLLSDPVFGILFWKTDLNINGNLT